MKIGLITDDIDDGNTGLATYSRGLIAGIERAAPDVDVTLVHRNTHNFYKERRELRVGGIGRGRSATRGIGNKLLRKQLLMPLTLRRHGFDVVHDTYHYAPLIPPSPYAGVVTIHDLVPLVMPEVCACSMQSNITHRVLVRLIASRAKHVITDSECTKRDVVRYYGIDPQRISAIHLAAEEHFKPLAGHEPDLRVRERYGLPDRFILYAGAIEPRKNLVRLIEAFERAAPQLGEVGLVLAGGLGWKYDPIVVAAKESALHERIQMLGRVSDEDLAALYRLALAFVFPSLYEGFGLPPLEAMQSGCPVITSNVSSLPEVVGNAAITVDPLSVDRIARALADVVMSDDLRAKMRDRGLARARQFSWKKCAEETIDVYQRVAGTGRIAA